MSIGFFRQGEQGQRCRARLPAARQSALRRKAAAPAAGPYGLFRPVSVWHVPSPTRAPFGFQDRTQRVDGLLKLDLRPGRERLLRLLD